MKTIKWFFLLPFLTLFYEGQGQEYELITDFDYDEILSFKVNDSVQNEIHHYFILINEEGTFLLDMNLDTVISTKDKGAQLSICPFGHGGLAAVKKNGRYGFINLNGDWVIEPKYRLLTDCGFKDEYAVVAEYCKLGVINLKGEVVFDFIYSGFFYFPWYRDQFMTFDQNGKGGILNEKGEVIIPFMYDHIMIEDKDIYYVEVGEENFYINKENKKIEYDKSKIKEDLRNIPYKKYYEKYYEKIKNYDEKIKVYKGRFYDYKIGEQSRFSRGVKENDLLILIKNDINKSALARVK